MGRGGENSGFENINLSNTCTIDNFLWICLPWYTSHPELLNTLKDSGNTIIHHFSSIIDLLISGCYNEGKYKWIAQYKLENHDHINAIGSDTNYSYMCIKDLFVRVAEDIQCSNSHCLGPKQRKFIGTELNLTDTKYCTNSIEAAIKIWESGSDLTLYDAWFDVKPPIMTNICRLMKNINVMVSRQ